MALGRVDRVVGGVDLERIGDLVEDEELALGPEVGCVRDTGREQMLLSPPRDPPRVAVIGLPRYRVGDLADERQRRLSRERVEDGGRRIGHEQHVALRDALPAADGGAVEAEPLLERAGVQRAERHRHVLPASEEVAELEVDHLRFRLARPGKRLAGLRLRPVGEVVLLDDLLHARLLYRCQQKRPGVGSTSEAPSPTTAPSSAPADRNATSRGGRIAPAPVSSKAACSSTESETPVAGALPARLSLVLLDSDPFHLKEHAG
jgi:hypothetical protein